MKDNQKVFDYVNANKAELLSEWSVETEKHGIEFEFFGTKEFYLNGTETSIGEITKWFEDALQFEIDVDEIEDNEFLGTLEDRSANLDVILNDKKDKVTDLLFQDTGDSLVEFVEQQNTRPEETSTGIDVDGENYELVFYYGEDWSVFDNHGKELK